MPDSPYLHWFDTSAAMERVSSNNKTTFFITGEEAFEDLGDRLEFDAGQGAEAYLLGWSFTDSVEMRPAATAGSLSTMNQLLSNFAAKGGAIRAMLWDNTLMPNSGGTKDGVTFINRLPNSKAILDHRTALAGTHHQKIQAVVAAPEARDAPALPVSYCGGMDIFLDRVGPQSLHDVHCKVIGDGAVDVVKVFLERWNDHPERDRVLSPSLGSAGSLRKDVVQVCRTYPQFRSATIYGFVLGRYADMLNKLVGSNSGFKPGDMRIGGAVKYYGFYDHDLGVQQVWRAVKHAIGEARRYIYLEDQYLVHKWVGDELGRKLANADADFRIVILALHPDLSDIQQTWPRRRDLLAALYKVDPGQKRWRILSRRVDRPHAYIHSKTWIFDDELIITGSANADRRGFTYNSEADLVVAGDLIGPRGDIVDPTTPSFGARTVAQELRCRLFAKHLGGRPDMYLDAKQAIRAWFGALRGGDVAPFNPNQRRGDPDKYVEALQAMANDRSSPNAPEATLVLNLLGSGVDDFFWDNFEDPDSGVAQP